tara:strand:- start:506 stop:5833 length:5328 start_codon:yes stop_codon:yes gene_type:complete
MPINVSAFNGCSKIVNFQIPNTLSSIPNGMLDQCDNINSIIIPPGVVLDTSSDIGNDNTIYNVTIDISANDSTNLTRLDISSAIHEYIDTNNFQTLLDKNAVKFHINIASGPISIPDYAFSQLDKNIFNNIVDIQIPSSVTAIGNYAFGHDHKIDAEQYYTYSKTPYKQSSELPRKLDIDYNKLFTDVPTFKAPFINSIILPDTLTSIGEGAFCNNIYLTNINLPQSLETFGEKSFYGCWNLESMTIPNSVSNIDDSAFEKCISLTDITFVRDNISLTSLPTRMFFNCISLSNVYFNNISIDSIPVECFFNCKSLQKLEIIGVDNAAEEIKISNRLPDDVTIIHKSAFSDCAKIPNLEFPTELKKIQMNAFKNCRKLIFNTFPSSVEYIGYSSFNGCEQIPSLLFQNSNTRIRRYAFHNCTNLRKVALPYGSEYIDNYNYFPTKCTFKKFEANITINSKSQTTQKNGKYHLTTADITREVKKITDEFAKDGVKNTNINDSTLKVSLIIDLGDWGIIDKINSSVKINTLYIKSCNKLTTECFKNSEVKTVRIDYIDNGQIPNNAFHTCKLLKHFETPKYLHTIGEYAFYKCESLTYIEIDKWYWTTIGKYAFHESGLKTVKLSKITYKRYRTVNDDQSNSLLQISNVSYAKLTDKKKGVISWRPRYLGGMIPDDRNSDHYNGYINRIPRDNLFTDTNEFTMEQWKGNEYACYDKGLVALDRYNMHVRDKCNFLEKHHTKHESDSILEKQKNNAFTGARGGYIRFPRNCSYIRCFSGDILSHHFHADYALTYPLNDKPTWKNEDPLNRGFWGAGLVSLSNGIYSDYPVRNAVKKFYHGTRYDYVNICIGNVKYGKSPYLINEYKNVTSIKNVYLVNPWVSTVKEWVYSNSSWKNKLSKNVTSNDRISVKEEMANTSKVQTFIDGIKDNKFAIAESQFENCTTIEFIEFSNGTNYDMVFPFNWKTNVTHIDKKAFKNCHRLKTRGITDNVTNIGEQAFKNCRTLDGGINLSNVLSMGEEAFANCISLPYVTVHNNSSLPNCQSIPKAAFINCVKLGTAFTFTNANQSIGELAFANCSNLNGFYFEPTTMDLKAVEYKYTHQFTNSSNIVTQYPDVTPDYVYDYMYYANTSNNIDIRNISIENIYTDRSCSTASRLKINDTYKIKSNEIYWIKRDLTAIPDHNQPNSTLTDLPSEVIDSINGDRSTANIAVKIIRKNNNMHSIGKAAFIKCSKLDTINLEDTSITEISDLLFSGCTSLPKIKIPDTVTKIGKSAFTNCSALTEVIIPDSVTEIDNMAFMGCISLTSITIPASVTTLGREVFFGCKNLESVTIGNTNIKKIPDSFFFNCNDLSNVDICLNVIETVGKNAFFSCRTLPDTIINGMTNLQKIENNAFMNCHKLTDLSLNINNTLTTIGKNAFLDCNSLSNVTISETVTSIGINAFARCNLLSNVTLPINLFEYTDTYFKRFTSDQVIQYTSIGTEDVTTKNSVKNSLQVEFIEQFAPGKKIVFYKTISDNFEEQLNMYTTIQYTNKKNTLAPSSCFADYFDNVASNNGTLSAIITPQPPTVENNTSTDNPIDTYKQYGGTEGYESMIDDPDANFAQGFAGGTLFALSTVATLGDGIPGAIISTSLDVLGVDGELGDALGTGLTIGMDVALAFLDNAAFGKLSDVLQVASIGIKVAFVFASLPPGQWAEVLLSPEFIMDVAMIVLSIAWAALMTAIGGPVLAAILNLDLIIAGVELLLEIIFVDLAGFDSLADGLDAAVETITGGIIDLDPCN